MSQDFILCECELFFSHLGFICSTTKCRLRKNLLEKVIFKASLFWVGWEFGNKKQKITENQVKTTNGYIVKKEARSSRLSLLTLNLHLIPSYFRASSQILSSIQAPGSWKFHFVLLSYRHEAWGKREGEDILLLPRVICFWHIPTWGLLQLPKYPCLKIVFRHQSERLKIKLSLDMTSFIWNNAFWCSKVPPFNRPLKKYNWFINYFCKTASSANFSMLSYILLPLDSYE